jgi:hypothetical protein
MARLASDGRWHRINPIENSTVTSKHYRWQTRWSVNAAAGTATHDTGIQVETRAGSVVIVDPEAATQILAVKNGPHNAPIMLKRLAREAAQMLNNPN